MKIVKIIFLVLFLFVSVFGISDRASASWVSNPHPFPYWVKPLPPTSVIATVGTCGTSPNISISWTPAGDATASTTYRILRSNTSGGPYTQIVSGITNPPYLNVGLTAGTTYYYVVRAVLTGSSSSVDSDNSTQSNAATAIVVTPCPPPPSIPTGVTASTGACGTTNAVISWTASSGTGPITYKVFKTTTPGNGYVQVVTGVVNPPYLGGNLAAGLSYYFVVKAVNAGGDSAYSAETNPGVFLPNPVCPLGPDLTASIVPQSTAVVGTPMTFTSNIQNSGNASTVSGFTNLFQTSPIPDPVTASEIANVIDYPVPGMPALASGANSDISRAITFGSVDTIYIRACADKSFSADVNGTIAEVNENNNCSSSWTPVTVAVSSPSPTASLTAVPSVITLTQSTTLWWSSTNADFCTADFTPFSGLTSGSQPVTPSILPMTYNVTCVNTALGQFGKGTATVSTTVKRAPDYEEPEN